jgi:phosphoenolpyruvate carboxylase
VAEDGEAAQAALSADIHLLGDLLGEVIVDQEGETFFDLEERIRALAKGRRSGERPSAGQLDALIATLDLHQAQLLTKAFATYFQLVNIAEETQRTRRLRARERASKSHLHESVSEAIAGFRKAGLPEEAVHGLLDSLSVRPVLTAHPTEAKRDVVLAKLRRISESLHRLDVHTLLPREVAEETAFIREEIAALWQTTPTRAASPSVLDEVQHGIYFLRATLMDVVPELYAELEMALARYYPGQPAAAGQPWQVPPFLRFGSWMGGDRDGNPFVKPETTLSALQAAREAARDEYRLRILNLAGRLTQSLSEVGASDELLLSIADDAIRYPDLAATVSQRFPAEPYRQKLALIAQRLDDDAYATGADLLADLTLIEESLHQHRGGTFAAGHLGRLIRQVQVFGLNLASLDIRQHSSRHTQALDEILARSGACQGYAALPEAEREAILTREIRRGGVPLPAGEQLSPVAADVVETFRIIREAHQRFGRDCIGAHVISFTQGASDVLAALLLAQGVGISHDLDIVPLFESVRDLRAAPQIMADLFANVSYSRHLSDRGRRQQVMIGYSDSDKEAGYLAANRELYQVQRSLVQVCRDHGVALELFHGRGGSIERGGGPSNRSILAQPPGSVAGRIKLTEQGEVIAERYASPHIAYRHLSQVVNAVLRASAPHAVSTVSVDWVSALAELADSAYRTYRALVYETPGFEDYFRQATPIDEIVSLQIGSRPARRQEGGIETLRAIPWVFAWMQSRVLLPGWYGLGTALHTYAERSPAHRKRLAAMYRGWAFFATVIDNAQMALAKADMPIARLYAGLVRDAALRNAVFGRIEAEHELAGRMVVAITGQQSVLDNQPELQRSIRLRNPYVDPLNYIQVELLRRLRSLDGDDPQRGEIAAAVLRTINGVAAAMKNTG